ncbi:asparagine synthase (glutamine-hydrolyzing) [Psychrosphaera algicola]|uniref:asparagine synthase (glutamine-hydrolyzing) n=1 Tax=Psychrosphaera algicola TaxID=3023714 RepID=A0ABT5FJM2_9GAMM|nr:asparagine synthase (glutamine-hydrolyzing) [Psychrosphaera sp. G1-22]MDC2891355.1 asparagine synthase (glutamine-hydrolyzing) [Psychrosphaera sp. G1-22]
MGDVIQYRGPDGQGIYNNTEEGVGLGNQRLAILDIENGDQPFFSDDGSIVVVQNGEIFNHVELASELEDLGFPCKTHCDTEVILRLYECNGIEAISKLNGMFAIAIWDDKLKTMFIVRDRVGEKPLYFGVDNNTTYFGSEIKSILTKMNAELDCDSLVSFLSFNYVPMPDTMFKNVKQLKPGHLLKVTQSGVEEVKWWDLSEIKEIEDKSEADWISEFNQILDDAVRIRLRADVPFGAFLSGGVDSSSVVGFMAKHLVQPVNTYCIGFDDPLYDESPFAQEAANRFKTKHKTEIVEANLLKHWPMATYHCDQPHGDVSFLPTYRVAKLASEDVKMVLTGDGADELFAGYDKYKSFFSDRTVFECDDESFEEAYAENISLFSQKSLGNLLSESVKDSLTSSNSYLLKVRNVLREVPHMDRINKALYLDTQLLLSGNNLVKPDRMGMAVSIENRAPFLDYRMIELAFSMPGSLKLKENETKYIYKKAVSDLIGENLAYRKKQMFTVPVGDWFKSTLRHECEELLLSKRAIERGLFNYDVVDSILANHCNGSENNTREIRALMAVEHWCRAFLDK